MVRKTNLYKLVVGLSGSSIAGDLDCLTAKKWPFSGCSNLTLGGIFEKIGLLASSLRHQSCVKLTASLPPKKWRQAFPFEE